MTGYSKFRWVAPLAAAAVTLAVVATWPFWGSPLFDQFVVRQLSAQLDSRYADTQAREVVERIAELGRPGIPALVSALGHRRASVSQAARTALRGQLDRWRLLPAEEASRNVALVARCLAQQTEQFGATARAEATQLAMQFLVWPLDGAAVDRVQVVMDCEQVLAASAAARDAARGEGWELMGASESGVTAPRQATPKYETSVSPAGFLVIEPHDLPGGDLPIEIVEIPSLPPSLVPPLDLQPPDPNAPKQIPPSMRPMPGLLFPEPEPRPSFEAAPIETKRAARGPADEPSFAESTRPHRQQTVSEAQLPNLTTREVMNYLHSDNAGLAKAAQDDLIRRGFDVYELAAARRLGSPDSADRRELADALSALPISPARWLLWLSEDDDARVRLNAVAQMATASDPRLTGRLQKMRRTERDRRVSELLERWARDQSRRTGQGRR